MKMAVRINSSGLRELLNESAALLSGKYRPLIGALVSGNFEFTDFTGEKGV